MQNGLAQMGAHFTVRYSHHAASSQHPKASFTRLTFHSFPPTVSSRHGHRICSFHPSEAEKTLLVVAALVHENNNVSRSKSQAMPDKYLERCRNIGNADYDAFCEDAILSADL